MIRRHNDLYFEAAEVFFLSLIVAVIGSASEQPTDWNTTVTADDHWKGPGRRSVR